MKKRIAVLLILPVLLFLLASSGASDLEFGTPACGYLKEIEAFGARVTGGETVAKTETYLADTLSKMGYTVERQPFTFEHSGVRLESRNFIVSTKGKSKKAVIIGAHFDSVDTGGSRGADDNGAGAALVLEMAGHFANRETELTYTFILFGAEEQDRVGSEYFVSSLSEEERENILAMINIDCIYSGDDRYLYGGEGVRDQNGTLTGEVKNDWLFQFAWDLSETLGLEMKNKIGQSENLYPGSVNTEWSDHLPFKRAGIPYLYFEATVWDPVISPHGLLHTRTEGNIIHTWKDTLTFIDSTFPGRGQEHLKQYSTLLFHILTRLPADYSGVDSFYEDFLALDQSQYTKGSYLSAKEEIEQAYLTLPRGLLYFEKDDLNSCLLKLENAIEKLVPLEIQIEPEEASDHEKLYLSVAVATLIIVIFLSVLFYLRRRKRRS